MHITETKVKPINFHGYMKFKGTPGEIKDLKQAILSKTSHAMFVTNTNAKHNGQSVELLTGKELDKFLGLMKVIHFPELRDNLSKYIQKNPIQLEASSAFEKFKTNKLDLS